jgi:hypothetical protein
MEVSRYLATYHWYSGDDAKTTRSYRHDGMKSIRHCVHIVQPLSMVDFQSSRVGYLARTQFPHVGQILVLPYAKGRARVDTTSILYRLGAVSFSRDPASSPTVSSCTGRGCYIVAMSSWGVKIGSHGSTVSRIFHIRWEVHKNSVFSSCNSIIPWFRCQLTCGIQT